MLIANRNGMLVKGGYTARDYVQDGLIAMWDGEWNAGPGVHDAALGKCVNLGYGGTFDTPWYYQAVGDDYAEVLDDNPYLNLTNSEGSVSRQIATAWTSVDGGATIEVVINNIGNNGTTRGITAAGGGGAGSIAIGGSALCGVGWKNYRSGYDFSPGAWNVQTAVVGLHRYEFYINGELVDSQSNPSFSPREDYKTFTTFPGGGTNSKAFRFHNWRFYTKPLTSDEIAANYAVDKARFNLP